ncbi:MAG: cytochrome c biogenesis protein ResB [Mycobacteriaceae bacterium]
MTTYSATPLRHLVALVRNTWRSLTSMRIALILLFLLALAAVPGALLPQRSLNSQKVVQYIAQHPQLGPWMDRLELFDVFSSYWFTSIYVLLFVSLIGCLIPRLIEHFKALRTQPVAVPRNLSRLPRHRVAAVNKEPAVMATEINASLRRWRTMTRVTETGVTEISAEKGYLREAGNLVFHFSLVGLLVAIAVGKLFGYEGNVIVIANAGPGFCTTSPAVFDSFTAGLSLDGTGLEPVCLRVKNFTADYLPNGQAEMFTSDIQYQAGDDLDADIWRDDQLKVNDPLRIAGDRVYLQGHGYAPQFTVTFPDGTTRTEALQWRPDDARTFLSSGALRIDPPGGMYPDAEERRKNQVAIEGLFAPTAFFHGSLLSSSFPAADDPAVAIDIYQGDTGLDTGSPQSLFSLSRDLIDQKRLNKQARVNLRPGESATLPDGTQVRFDKVFNFVNLQVSHDPAQNWVLIFAVAMIAGLLVSLLVKRRRIWVRLTATEIGTHAELGGIARTDQAGWGAEFQTLATRLLGPETAASTAERKV